MSLRTGERRRLIEVMKLNPEHETRFQSWLAEHGGILSKVARAYAIGQRAQAELLQELKLQVWSSTKSFSGEAKASTWIYRVCLNTALTWRRGQERREQHLDHDTDVSETSCHAAGPAEELGRRELIDLLYNAIHALPEIDRALLLLSLDGVSYREIGDVTGMSENHVGVALTRARQRLARQMKGVIHELE